MIKRTLFFGNPVYLKTKQNQMVVQFPKNEKEPVTIPIEDIGVIVLEHPQITITNYLLQELTYRNVAVINCDKTRLPIGLLMPLAGNSLQAERFKTQINASEPLKKQLWRQTITAKINNQAAILQERGVPNNNMLYWAKEVTSGDTKNHEARAAAYYWSKVFLKEFYRRQQGDPPNHLLNYGYAILRGITARALVSSGMLPTLGIFHSNKYNAYCLADDIMEPYRPFVDRLVYHIVDNKEVEQDITKANKEVLLTLPALDVIIDGKKSPLMVAMSRTTNSLYECFAGISRKVLYPVIC